MPKAPKISIERIKEVLSYCSETGSFIWKKNTSKANRVGQEAGKKPAYNGYRYISIDGGDYLAQKIAYAIMNNKFPSTRITFKDGDRLNLKWDNLIEWKWATKSKFNHSTPEGRAEYGRAWRSENAEKNKDISLKQDFGISIDQYNQILIFQKGCCAICNNPETATRSGKIKALAVDHDHETGFIRELLCNTCNVGLGAFGDDVKRIESAIKYLQKHKKTQSNVVHIKGAKQ